MLDFVSFFVKTKKEINSIKNKIKKNIELKEIFNQSSCLICGNRSNDLICLNCKKRIKKYEIERFISNKNSIKNLLKCEKIYFDSLFYLYEYKGLIRKIILNYKFYNKSYFCNFFAKMLLNCKKTYRFFSFYDIIIPVPMEKGKRLQRGYNQAELITNIICKNTKILNGNLFIKKIRKTKIQSTLNLNQRKENIKNAFCVNKLNEIIGKKIVLFDDVCTTGNTVNEISRILKEAGASEVLVIVLAKD